MALDESSGTGMYMPVAPAYGGGNGGFGFGNDWAWIIILLLAFNGGFGGFGGGYGNMALGYDFPWLLNGQNNINANTNGGFRDAMLNTSITSIGDKVTSGFGDVQTALCGGFAGVNASIANAQTANMQSLFGVQSALQNCCCESRANIADLKYTVATENCADRQVVNDGIRDILAATQAQTQTILNQLCSDKIEQKNDTIAQLRSELLYARGQASQDVQTAAIQAGQRALANEVEQYVAPRPIPSYYVQNPNCCGNYSTCGCGV